METFTELIRLRRQFPCLSKPEIDWVATSGPVLAFLRPLDTNQDLLVALNNSSSTQTMEMALKLQALSHASELPQLLPSYRPTPLELYVHKNPLRIELSIPAWQSALIRIPRP